MNSNWQEIKSKIQTFFTLVKTNIVAKADRIIHRVIKWTYEKSNEIKTLYSIVKDRVKSFITFLDFKKEVFLLKLPSVLRREFRITFGVFSLTYLLIMILGVLLLLYVDISPEQKDSIPTIYSAAATMVGGMIAIVFSFNTLLMQNAASQTSGGFYRLLGKDVYQYVIYFSLGFITLLLFALSWKVTNLDVKGDIAVLLALLGATFYIIFWLYWRLFDRIDPNSSLRLINKNVQNLVYDLKNSAERATKVIEKNPNKRKNQIQMYSQLIAYDAHSYHFDQLDSTIKYLFDYHDKLMERKERNSFVSSGLHIKNY